MLESSERSRREVIRVGLGGLGAWLGAGMGWGVARAVGQELGVGGGIAVEGMIGRGVGFLKGRQGADGSWSSDRKEPGITALVLTALLRSGQVTAFEPVITRGLQYLEPFLGEDGGLSGAAHANYTTAIAMLAYREANVNGRYDGRIKAAQGFLQGKQWDEGEGKDSKDPFYGGAGYGGRNSRPDLSNTSFMIEALRETGLAADDPSLQKALIFISRCQNLESEFNDQPWAGKVNDGGFIYTPAQGGVSMAGPAADGGLRSYAGMTYAGLKSMIYAGLTREDARVKAALKYIQHNYTLEENPGLGQAGLYYYYQVFAKALALLGEATLRDAAGVEHDWRGELTAALAKRQRADGSWVNGTDRFMEGDANLVTAYALLALDYARREPRGLQRGG